MVILEEEVDLEAAEAGVMSKVVGVESLMLEVVGELKKVVVEVLMLVVEAKKGSFLHKNHCCPNLMFLNLVVVVSIH